MPSPKTLIAIAVPWLASLVAVFWFGQRSAPKIVVEREVVVEREAPALVDAAPTPAPSVSGLVPTDAFQVVADAEEHLRAGVLSQRGVLKAFNSMQQLAADSVIDAVVEVEAMDPGQPNHGLLMLAVLGRWAEIDGPAAMRYAEERLEGELRSGVIANVVSSWSESDPEGALAWYRERRDEGELAAVLGGSAPSLLAAVFQGLAATDAEAALSALNTLADPEEFNHALGGMVSAMAAAGRSEQLLGHIGRLPAGRRDEARRTLIAQWAQFSPSDAAIWVGRLPNSAERGAMAKDVSLAWVRREPQAALSWMFEHTANIAHPENLAAAVAIWARADPNAAATWLGGGAPEGVDTDPAVAALSRQIVQRDPVSAFAWASSVRNPAMRDQAQASVFAQWAIREPVGAGEYLDKAEMPEEQAARLRAMLP